MIYCEEADGNSKKVGLLVALVVTVSIATITATLILGWCYIQKGIKMKGGKCPYTSLLKLVNYYIAYSCSCVRSL